MLYSGGSWVDSRYAHRADMELIEFRLDQKVVSDRVYQLREEIFQLERQYSNMSTAPPAVQDRYRRLQAELQDALREQDRVNAQRK